MKSSKKRKAKPSRTWRVYFFVFLGILLLLLGVLAGFLYFKINRFFTEPSVYKQITLSPFDFKRKGLLHFYWDSVSLESSKWEAKLKEFQIRLQLLPRPALSVSSGQTRFHTLFNQDIQDTASLDLPSSLEFPDFRIPLQVSVHLNEILLNLDSGKYWEAEFLRIQSENSQEIRMELKNLKGDYVASPVHFNSRLYWNHHFVDLEANFVSESDSIRLNLNAPRTSLQNMSGETNIGIQEPEFWIFKYFLDPETLEDIPHIRNFNTKASFSLNPFKPNLSYKASVQFDMDEYWPLPPLHAQIESFGNPEKTLYTDIRFNGDHGEKIQVKGNIDLNGNGSFTGFVENMKAEFGPEIMSMDATIHSAEIQNNTLTAKVETSSGSMVLGTISNLYTSPHIQFEGDISDKEPWAVQWSKGLLVLGSRPQITGSFHKNKMESFVKIFPLQYAYAMQADYFETHLVLDINGITFDHGIIRKNQEDFSFTGRVLWDDTRKDSVPHTAWKLRHKDSSSAEVWVSFDSDLFLSLNHINTTTIPFADTNLLRGFQANVSGEWEHHFETNIGQVEISFDAQVKDFELNGHVQARENGDSVILENARISHLDSEIEFEARALLTNNSHLKIPIRLQQAKVITRKFHLPTLLNTFGFSALSSGNFNGEIFYDEKEGAQGFIDFQDITFNQVDADLLEISRLKIAAAQEKVEVTATLSLGNGAWSGNTQILVNDILSNSRYITASHSTDQGGTLWTEGILDSNLFWKGDLYLNGSWYLPSGIGEIQNTDFKAEVEADIRKGINGIQISFHSDSTLYKSPVSFFPEFPLNFSGKFHKGILDVYSVKTFNENGEFITASGRFDVNQLELKALEFNSDRYTFNFDEIHHLLFENVKGSIRNSEKELIISSHFPSIEYRMKHSTYGDADAKIRGDLSYRISHSEKGSFSSNSIEGLILIDRAVYRKQINIDFGINSLNKLLNSLSNFFINLRREKPGPIETTSSVTTRPTGLSIHILESLQDSLAVVTNVATFPFTVDVRVLGTTAQPILRGDINNAGNGFIGFDNLFHFDLQSLAISWRDVPWRRGTVDVISSQNLPYCGVDKGQNETCPVYLNFKGSITNPQPEPTSNCAARQSPASIYYSILLGCISEEDENSYIDGNKVAGKIIGTFLTTTANKTLGGDYVGDIEMKLHFFNDYNALEKDSSYLKIPISLDRWVKNLNLIFGYTQDQSVDPVYDQAFEIGLTYKLPIFDESETSHIDHLDPQLNFRGNLISRRYHSVLGSNEKENRIEKNIGFDYGYQFWTPSLLGIGRTLKTQEKNDHENQ